MRPRSGRQAHLHLAFAGLSFNSCPSCAAGLNNAMARPVRRPRLNSGLRWLATMSTAVLLAVIVTHDPGQTSDAGRRQRRLIGTGDEGWVAGVPGSAAAWESGAARAAGGRATAAAGSAAGDTLGAAAAGSLQPFASHDDCVTAATTGPTPLHGWVEKSGPLPMHLLDGPDTKQRHRAYFAWRDAGTEQDQTQEWMVNGTLTRVGRPPPLFPYCRILVNHMYRTMYLKAPKTGSTSLLTLLGSCTNSSADKATCFQPLEVVASEEEYEQMYSNYFVFAVVRNPWARAVSSYRMLSRYLKKGCKDLVGGWNNVCLDVNRLPLVHNKHPLCTIARQQGEGFAMHHLIPQAPCLVTASGEWAADYVVRTENLEEDMREVLTEMNARRQPDAPALDVDALLGQLTNVNKVKVACRGLGGGHAEGAAASSSTAGQAGGSGNSSSAGSTGNATVTLSKEIAAVARRKVLGARVVHLEAPESYCATQMYYQGQHGQCFDALAAYYQDDVRLFGLPTCR